MTLKEHFIESAKIDLQTRKRALEAFLFARENEIKKMDAMSDEEFFDSFIASTKPAVEDIQMLFQRLFGPKPPAPVPTESVEEKKPEVKKEVKK